jgi:hypothetical protein
MTRTKFFVMLLILPLFLPTSSSFSSCDNWFEREILCNSIDVKKEWSTIFQEKDLTLCPERCQTCKNYDRLELPNATTTFEYLEASSYNNSNSNNTCISSGYDGYCYNDEEEYFQQQQQLYYDENGNLLSTMPWQMQYFYEYVHCARDFRKVPNIWKTGDGNNMYERIVREFPEYSPRVLSRPKDSAYAREAEDHNTSVGVGPWLVQLENFLTDEECDEMIAQTKIAIENNEDGYSLVADDEEGNEIGGACQSTQAWCDPDHCMEEPILKRAWKKIEEVVGLPFDTHTEPVHFIQYVPGQKYGSHTDAIPEEYNSVTGPRIFTLLFYLNDIEEGNGGETCFPQIERADGIPREEPICIRPKKGHAVIWPNILDELPQGTTEVPENRTWHEANGIQEGYKFASTVWYHLRNFSYARDIDCTGIYHTGFINDYHDDFDMDGNSGQYFGDEDDVAYGGNYYYDNDDNDMTTYTSDNNNNDDSGGIRYQKVANAKYYKNPNNFFGQNDDDYDDELPMAHWW